MRSDANSRRTYVFGVPVDDVSRMDAVETSMTLLDSKGCAFVVTPNSDCAVLAHSHPQLQQALKESDLSIPDGKGLILGSRIAGNPIRHHVPGRWLAEQLLRLADDRHLRVFLFGSTPDVLEKCTQRLRARFTNALVVGTLAPPYVETVDEAFAHRTAEIIKTARADVVLVALGMPKQEIWMASVRGMEPARLLVGVGGTLELLAGIRWRVPEWVSALGLEWLFRLIQEPTRLAHRYLVRDPRLFCWAVQARFSRGPA